MEDMESSNEGSLTIAGSVDNLNEWRPWLSLRRFNIMWAQSSLQNTVVKFAFTFSAATFCLSEVCLWNECMTMLSYIVCHLQCATLCGKPFFLKLLPWWQTWIRNETKPNMNIF
jgi:hypothetical protein